MATGDKNIQKVMEPQRAALLRRIFCIVLIVFGAFTAFFGVRSILNAEAVATAANAALAAAEKATSFNAVTVAVMAGILAVAGLIKIFLGIASILGKQQKLVNIFNIVNLVLVVIVFVAAYNVNWQFMTVLIVDLILSIVAICWLNAKLSRYLREMFGELKKLTWLSGKDLVSHTLAVIVFVVALAVIIWLLDLAFSSGFGAIAKIKIG